MIDGVGVADAKVTGELVTDSMATDFVGAKVHVTGGPVVTDAEVVIEIEEVMVTELVGNGAC